MPLSIPLTQTQRVFLGRLNSGYLLTKEDDNKYYFAHKNRPEEKKRIVYYEKTVAALIKKGLINENLELTDLYREKMAKLYIWKSDRPKED
ncbi:hypothetical protein MED121_16729 [Marinomonas sp. MED121]|uniref:hypothetical protein n=1 Tax=Marinomonas sp. MED121 TaxID=314277 RepID=UPI0000691051|nr:hypothetical protein [Marinomonas sp. MED121]EAQ67591.1 hypothetical protein MED121_16729 [Marinomonas sp. MED121]